MHVVIPCLFNNMTFYAPMISSRIQVKPSPIQTRGQNSPVCCNHICCNSTSPGQPVVQPHLHVLHLHGLHLGRQGRHGCDIGPVCCNYLARVLTPCPAYLCSLRYVGNIQENRLDLAAAQLLASTGRRAELTQPNSLNNNDDVAHSAPGRTLASFQWGASGCGPGQVYPCRRRRKEGCI